MKNWRYTSSFPLMKLPEKHSEKAPEKLQEEKLSEKIAALRQTAREPLREAARETPGEAPREAPREGKKSPKSEVHSHEWSVEKWGIYLKIAVLRNPRPFSQNHTSNRTGEFVILSKRPKQ